MSSSERPTGESIAAGPEERHETVRSEAFPLQLHSSLAAQIELTFRNALVHLQNRQPAKAFGDLVRISRTVPMTRRLAAYLVRFSLVAATEPAAITLLRAGAEDGEGSERFAVRRQLARLFRRAKDFDRARESLATILAEDPADRRARRVLNLLLEQEQRFEELEASLEKETREALRRGRRDRAAKALVARARLSARLGHAAQAALRYGQAAQHLEQTRQHAAAFELRLHWLSALVASDASRETIDEANQTCRVAAERVDQLDRWKQLARKLGLVPQDARRPVAPPPEEGVTPISTPEHGPEGRAAPERPESRPQPTEPAEPGPPPASTVLEMPVAEPVKVSALDVRRQEAQFVAAGRWAELAAFYREQVTRAKEVPPKLEYLSRLAEVLEDELDDVPGAIGAYGEMVTLAGDARALREQLRLIEKAGSPEQVAEALATAVERAPDEGSRADLLTLKGERALRAGDAVGARADFFAALRAAPRHLGAKVGLTESAAQGGELRPLRELLKNPGAIPRKYPGRAELFRRLAKLADRAEPELARIAWSEVFADLPQDEEARARLLALARELKDDAAFEPLARAQLAKEPRGPAARKARLELVAALERLGRADDALHQLREAVKFEPGHKEAWLLLADRFAALQRNAEAAWALEQAATATDDAGERAQTWDRLARFAREVLRDPAKAQVFARRADNARELQAPAPPEVAPSRVTIPAPPTSSITGEQPTTNPEDVSAILASAPPAATIPPPPRIVSSRSEPVRPSAQRAGLELPPAASIPPPPRIFASPSRAPVPPADTQAPPARESVAQTQEVPASGSRAGRAETQEVPAVEMTTPLEQVDFDRLRKGASLPPEPLPGEVLEWDAPPAELEMRRRTEDLIAIPDPFDPGPETSGFVASAALKNHEERDRLSQRVHERPLDSEGYRALEMFFHRLGDERRAVLMREIADALEDRAPQIAAPDHVLSPLERAGLRHPMLRSEAGELLSLIGAALLKAAGPRPAPALTREEFRLDSGRGARLVAEALLGVVRLLSIRAPDLFLSSENAPPVRCVFQNTPKLLIGRLAVRKELPEAQLRFFAARSLFAVHPETLVLEQVPVDVLETLLGSLGQALRGGRSLSGSARTLKDALPAKGRDRMAMLNAVVKGKLDLVALTQAAGDSNNRAGLVAAGGVAPALQSLKMLGAGQREILELVRFASSERYLLLRTRSAPRP